MLYTGSLIIREKKVYVSVKKQLSKYWLVRVDNYSLSYLIMIRIAKSKICQCLSLCGHLFAWKEAPNIFIDN